jgi:DNA-binding transcriptional LysR family regulator
VEGRILLKMETRHLRYVLTLSETLHFGRAAEREHITQSAFSQQVAKLEAEIGAKLFERRSNRVSLTPAGETFMPRAEEMLWQLRGAEEEARHIGAGAAGVLRIGIFPSVGGELTPLIVSAYRDTFTEVTPSFVELSMATQVDALANGRVDVAILTTPIQDPRLELALLFAEPRFAAVSKRHPLADAESINVGDLLDEPFAVAGDPAPQAWSSFWCCDPERGEPGRAAARVTSVTESLAAVSHLGAVDTFPAAGTRYFSHPDVAYVRIRDGAYAGTAVAWRVDDDRPMVRGFRRIAELVSREHLSVVHLAVPPDEAPDGAALVLPA